MRCAVLGDPIAHSLSPALHRAGYAAVGLDWTYEAHPVAAGQLAGFVRGLDASWRGLSLTMPLKREAADLASAVSPVARVAGAVNTLLLVDGALHGDNTDVPGAVAALRASGVGPAEPRLHLETVTHPRVAPTSASTVSIAANRSGAVTHTGGHR